VSDKGALARLRAICLAFPEAEEATLQDRPLFRVRSRRFALFNGASSPPRPRWNGFGRLLHFVTDPQKREALRQDRRFTTSPHHGDRGWVAISLQESAVDSTELAELLEAAYRHVAARVLVERLDRQR
jgi:predicted DNA-binding protein (MmcQ/YjbR family)